ncbi:diaminopimelate epimerase [Candidatus Fermentibacteria bacterium]|nr:diaminopimelate epimerase [Candidatus Fermentibacteria bacterium]
MDRSRFPPGLTPFAKVEALGNDLIWILDPAASNSVREMSRRAPRVCDRRLGVGADGIVLWNGASHNPELWFLNADGSTAEVCGNGLRALAVGGRDLGFFMPGSICFRITDAVFPVEIAGPGFPSAVGLGIPRFRASPALDEILGAWDASGALVFMPNPHIVVFDGPEARERQEKLAAELVSAVAGGANVGFCTTRDESIELEVLERGVGWTRACGSGAAAAAAATWRAGRFASEVTRVRQPGGILRVWPDPEGRIWIEGEAGLVFLGFLPPDEQAEGCGAGWNVMRRGLGVLGRRWPGIDGDCHD